MQKNRNGVLFDFDGTLTRDDVHLMNVVNRQIDGEFGKQLDKIDDLFLPSALAHEFTTHQEYAWGDFTLGVYVRHGLTLDDIERTLRNIVLRPYAAELLLHLDNHGIPWSIVSWGSAPFIRQVLKNSGVDPSHADVRARDFTFDAQGRIAGLKGGTHVIPETKGVVSREFAKSHGIHNDALYAIGDSDGDRYLGHLNKNRLGVFESVERRDRYAQHFGHTLLLEASFAPAADWLCDALELPRIDAT